MGRRQGQVRSRGAKTWLVSAYVGRDVDGKRQYVTETVKGTKGQAEEKLRSLLEKKGKGRLARPDQRAVGKFLDWWLENVAKVRVRASTHASYKAIVETYLKPDLGELRLDKLTSLQVQALVKGLSERGLSARTVRYASAILGGAMRYAVKHRLLVWNPTEDVELPRERRRELGVPGAAARARLLAELEADPLWPLWCVMVTTGLRPGEALGLRWSDLDLDAGSLAVQRSLSRTGEGWELTEPKTAQGRRAVSLPAEAAAVLREHRDRQRTARETFEEKHAGLAEQHGLVFEDALGRPLEWRNVRHRHFSPALRRAIMTCSVCGLPLRATKEGKLEHAGPVLVGATAEPDHKPEAFTELEGLRPYDLRHLHASLLLARGVDLKTVSQRLGHADAGFTLKTYTHLVPGTQEAAAQAIGAEVFGNGSASKRVGR